MKIKRKKIVKNKNYNKQLRVKDEDIKYQVKNTKCCGGGGVTKYRSFRMCLNLNDYQFKPSSYMSTYTNHMATTNQKHTIDTQNQKERNTSILLRKIITHKGRNKKKK